MSGSSRALQRALASVFEAWDSSLDWKNEPSPQIKALYGTIYKYLERHNTMSTSGGSANDEMRAAHEEYVKTSEDLSREVFFLLLLTRLLPVLSEAEVSLWLHTYLRPAIDSAGFDNSFVNQARAFIHSLTLEVYSSDDALLLHRRHLISNMVMEHIARIFIGGNPAAYAMIGMSVLETERDTQIHIERVRFIEKNACSLLQEWGLKNPRPFFLLLHKFYLTPLKRFKVLDLASRVVSCNVSQIQKMLDTPFFPDLLRSLLLDCSETILGSCLSILLMTIGKVCHKISAYLPELLAIYTRLVLWKEHGTQLSTNEVTGVMWKFAESDQNTSIMQTQIYKDGQFNMLYFSTLIYGLFPLNLLAFCKSPHDFLSKNPPKTLVRETATIQDAIAHNEDLRKSLATKSNQTLLRLMLHPNLLNATTLQDELNFPINWILKKNEGSDVAEEEVLIECYALNPDIFFSIPETIILPDRLFQKIQSVNGCTNQDSDLKVLQSVALNESSFPTSHRGSIQLSSENPLDSKLPSLWLNMDRRVSIVPTRLVLENNGPVQIQTPSLPQPDIQEIKFKSVDFGGGGSSINSDSTVRDDKSIETKKKDHLSDLYTVHEKLFTSSAAVAANQTTVNTDTAHSTAGNFQGSTSTASNILTKQLQTEGKADVSSSDTRGPRHQSAGSALDFYQRELLLMKNELEFSSYMKHLNKHNYVKLKLKFNRMIKDQSIENVSRGVKEHSREHESLIQSMKKLQEASEEAISKKTEENEKLLAKVRELQQDIAELRGTTETAKSVLNENESIVERLKTDVKTKENNVRELKYKVGVLEQIMQKTSISKQKKKPEHQQISLFLNEQETEIARFQVQLGMLQAENKTLEMSLKRTTEELELQRKNVEIETVNKNSDLRKAFSIKEDQYERKLKELTTLKAKYELVLDEQSARIAHLSKAKPIRIPGMSSPTQPNPASQLGPRTFSTTPHTYLGETSGDYFSRNDAIGQRLLAHEYSPQKDSMYPSLESASLSATTPALHVGDMPFKTSKMQDPPRSSSSASIPIVRGRGGYQKRSKKIM